MSDESAFPIPGSIRNGMTLRDYFAAKAIQTVLAGANLGGMPGKDEQATKLADMCAEAAYAIADAMLRARQA